MRPSIAVKRHSFSCMYRVAFPRSARANRDRCSQFYRILASIVHRYIGPDRCYPSTDRWTPKSTVRFSRALQWAAQDRFMTDTVAIDLKETHHDDR
jgi:hypothetical protein